MAWRLSENLMDGELDNTIIGKVSGFVRFYRRGKKPLTITLNLIGNFHEDIRSKKLRLKNHNPQDRNEGFQRQGSYVDGLARIQNGQVGDITAGLKVNDTYPYVNYPYIEWYSEENGRVVLELEPSQIKIIGKQGELK